jgi:MFS family permease
MQNYKLTREQKEAVGLLSIGTFLEYFDLMLYVHMAVLLNELFFPKTDPFTASLISAFSFCSTYILRPIGALLFGYIGDCIGRKAVVIITTLIMSMSCIVIGVSPTYAQIGITATWIITICRMIQGMAANAEARGAELYITESFKPPIQYPLVATITVFTAVGTSVALGICSIFTDESIAINQDFSWRVVFFVGAIIGLVGTVARTSLKEATDYSRKKQGLKLKFEKNDIKWGEDSELFFKESIFNKTSIYYFFINCARPPCFYFIYIYCGDVLKQNFMFTPNQVINQNFLVSLVDLSSLIVLTYISAKIYPLKILKAKLYLFFFSTVSFPVVIGMYPSGNVVFIYQCLASMFVFDHIPATPIFYKYFPILNRFTYTSVISALAKVVTYLITSFGLVFATKYLGYWGMFIILIPVGIAFYCGVSFFQRMELGEE